MRQFIKTNLVKVAALLAMLSLTCIAAIGQEVRSNYLSSTNFAQYHTYKWVTTKDRSDDIVDAQIKQAVDSQLAVKGLVKTESGQADLELDYKIGLEQQREWNAFGTGGFLWGGGMGSATSSNITNGSLVLGMYDPARKQLIWTGIATKTLNPSGNQNKTQKNLNKAMQKLLKNYPST